MSHSRSCQPFSDAFQNFHIIHESVVEPRSVDEDQTMSCEARKFGNMVDNNWKDVLSRRIYAVTDFQPVFLENMIDVLQRKGAISGYC